MDLIYNFWIIHRDSGLCIFDQKFNNILDEDFSSDLVGGFLIAILSFSNEIAKQDIDFIQMQNIRISFKIMDEIVMVVSSSNESDHNRNVSILQLLQERFLEKYNLNFSDYKGGDVSKFKSFASEVEQAFHVETRYLSILQKRSDQMKEYFNSATKGWSEVWKGISDHAANFGAWRQREIINLDSSLKNDLLEARKLQSENPEHTHKGSFRKRKWV